MPSPKPALDELPEEILERVASCLNNGIDVWSFRATCGATWEAGEPASLENRKVVGDPCFLIDEFHAIDQMGGIELQNIRQSIKTRIKEFEMELADHPSALTHLRRLTIELPDDEGDAGWSLLGRVISQLTELNVHMNDRDGYVIEYQSYYLTTVAVKPTPPHITNTWARILKSSSPLLNLTKLSIATTTRSQDHLIQIAPHVPNLKELSLGNYHQAHRNNSIPPTGPLPPGRLPKLERITLIGDLLFLEDMLQFLTSQSGTIRQIVISPIDRMGGSYRPSVILISRVYDHLLSFPNLSKLAIYGPCAYQMVQDGSKAAVAAASGDGMADEEIARDDALVKRKIPVISTLLIERAGKGTDSSPNLACALLENVDIVRTELERLESLSWVNPPLSDESTERYSSSNSDDSDDSSEKPHRSKSEDDLETLYPSRGAKIQGIFSRYHHLRRVRWLSTYPSDPFGIDSPGQVNPLVKRNISRSESLGTGDEDVPVISELSLV